MPTHACYKALQFCTHECTHARMSEHACTHTQPTDLINIPSMLLLAVGVNETNILRQGQSDCVELWIPINGHRNNYYLIS